MKKCNDLYQRVLASYSKPFYETREPSPAIRHVKVIEYSRHRLPVDGGLTLYEVHVRQSPEPYPLLQHFKENGG